MRSVRQLLAEQSGAGAGEFALVLPLFLLFLLGIIDAGRYAWEYNRAEKATQIGARWAVATQIIPGGNSTTGLLNYSFAVEDSVPQGTRVELANFPGVYCQAEGSAADSPLRCTCKGTCRFTVEPDEAAKTAWTALVNRMNKIHPGIGRQNVRIDYDWSGLGFSGDPNGADVAPLVTVSLRSEPSNRISFRPMTLMLFNGRLGIPSASYTLTMEDGRGTDAN